MNAYFYIDSRNQQQGPISPERFAENGVTPQTLIWCVGMPDWKPAGTVPELKDFFRPSSPAGQAPEPPNPYGPQNEATAPPPPYGNAARQPYDYNRPTMPPRPDTYLLWAILSTICCCLPFGIVAIVKAFQVDSFYLKGMYEQAVLASADAQKWCILSLVFGLISWCAGSGWVFLF